MLFDLPDQPLQLTRLGRRVLIAAVVASWTMLGLTLWVVSR